MAFPRWGKKLKKRLSLPLFLQVKDLLDRIPGRPCQIARFFLLELMEPLVTINREFGTVRAGTPFDVPGMCLLEDKRELFLKRFREGEFCVVAVQDEHIVGYEWFSDKPFHIEDRFLYKIDIKKDSIYAYDAFVKPEFRMKGLWYCLQWYIIEHGKNIGRNKIIVMVDFRNDSWLNSHLRFGYVNYKHVLYIKLFSGKFFYENYL